MRRNRVVAPLLVILAACVCAFAFFRRMGNPEFWGSQISAFEKADQANPPKPGIIVFTGSSSIRFWKTLADDMKPLEVINRGFGGSTIAQVNHYASRIVLPYRPRAVVLYAGDNDLSWPSSKSPEQVFEDFQQFVEIIHSQLPETWIYYVSIKPTILRRRNWAKMQKTNQLIVDYIRTQPRTQFIDVSAAMLDGHGQPRAELFRWDGLHMSAKGYAIWTSIIKPVLLSCFGGSD
jgi:lysophospholipase L1-like esterase